MKKYFAVLLILVISIAIFKILNSHATFSDENVYFLMSKRVVEGEIPYKDFNFVHPPFQIYTIAIFFKLLGISLVSGKLPAIIFSSLSSIMVFLISKKILKDEKKAFLSTIFFILFPYFIIFSDHELGIWESLSFFLVSVYFLLNKKYFASSLFFSISAFYRYLVIFYFPLLLMLSKDRKKFSILSFSLFFIFLSIFLLSFGANFFEQTIKYQIFGKLFMETKLKKDYWQYFSFGIFTIPILLLSLLISYEKMNRMFILFSVYPIIYDLLLVFALKTIAYHYFVYSLPFVSICFSFSFFSKKSKLLKLSLVIILFLSTISSVKTMDFYLNKERTNYIEEIADYIASNVSSNDKIFGESTLTDYIAFSRNVSVAGNYLDAYVDYLRYLSEEKVLETLEKEKPKFIIEMNAYLTLYPSFARYINQNYVLDKIFEEKKSGIIYFIYKRIY
jgi:4-amino-4-deoxy-L-arabinose transferase-like glycosyltransferase